MPRYIDSDQTKCRFPIAEKNKLTLQIEKLLAEGGTVPDGVIKTSKTNYEYSAEWKYQKVFETPCGLRKKGTTMFFGTCSFEGEWHCPENDNVHMECPTPYLPCEYRRKDLPPGLQCPVKITDKPDDGSYEAKQHERLMRHQEAWRSAPKEWKWCFCMNERTLPSGEVVIEKHYDVARCISGAGCKEEYCICRLGQKRDLTKVNLYYDLHIHKTYQKGMLTFEDNKVLKGLKYFPKPIAKTDAEIALLFWQKQNPRLGTPIDLDPNRKMHEDIFFAEHHSLVEVNDKLYAGTIETWIDNIRIAKTAGRDLMQDLSDIQNGITVEHASDKEKADVAKKREAKTERLKKKIVNKMITVFERGRRYEGTGGMWSVGLDHNKEADVKLFEECLAEATRKFEAAQKKKAEENQQMRLF